MIVRWHHPDPPTACTLCRPFIGGTYRLTDIHPPPLHHRCRCSLQNLPDAGEDDLSPPPDWESLPEPVLAAWLAYVRWMLRKKIAIPLLLLPLLALLKGDTGDDEEEDDPPAVGQPTPHRLIKLDASPVGRVSNPTPPLTATESPPMPTDLPPTWTADTTRPDPNAIPIRLPTAFAPVSDYPTTQPPDDATARSSPIPNPRSLIPLRVIRSGRTRPIRGFPHGVTIPRAVLQEALTRDLFSGVPVFFSHRLDDGRDVRDMAGVLASPSFDDADGSVTAVLHPYHNNAGRELATLVADFRDHRESGIPIPDVGVSLDSYFTFAPADRSADPPAASRLTDLLSVDIVFRPAADGRILAQSDPLTGDFPMPDPTPIDPETHDEGPDDAPVPVPAAANGPRASLPATPLPVAAAATPPNTAFPAEHVLPDLDPSPWLHQLRAQATQATLAASGLPAPVQARLAAAGYDTPEQLDAAIRAARDELAQLAAAHVIHIGDSPPRDRLTSMRTGLDQIAEAVDWNFGVRAAATPEPNLRSLRTLYTMLSGDHDFYGRFEPDRVLLEGATTATLANLAANAMNKVIVQQFSALTFWRWYEHIAYATPNDGSVQDMQWTVIGGIANLPAVPEKAAYDELDVSDVAEIDPFVKYGGYVPITLELFRNSDIQRLQAIPRALALAAVRTRSEKVAAIFTANSGVGPTLSQDSTALFHADHGNLATTAFGSTATAWRAARAECFKHAELNSGKRLALYPKFWLGPADLYDQALANFGYGEGLPTAYTPEAQARNVHDPRPVPLVVPDFTDTTDWAYIVDPQVFPVIHISYAQAPGGGTHPAPELFTVASPTAGLMFTNDVLPIKVRDWFAVGVNGYRGIGKRNVAG